MAQVLEKKEESFTEKTCNEDVGADGKEPEIELAPIFRPTEEEFEDPLGYISKIRPIAERYGVCKIIPPSYWKPKFCLEMNNFKFTPRVQRLNELEAGTRIKLNFLDKLSKFWELQGKKFRIPTLERKQLDLHKLNKLVETMGGYEELIKTKKWPSISKELNLKEPTSSRIIKTHYENILYPFLLFEAGVTLPAGSSTTGIKRPNMDRSSSNDSSEGETPSTSPKKAKKKCTKSSKKDYNIESIHCLVCERGDDEAMMLLCDGCDDSYHTYCLFPPLKEIPKGDWRCPLCVSEICKKPTDLYGFCQSKRKYTLTDFGTMADKFKEDYFGKPHKSVTSDEIEKEFWKILSNPDEQVSVEYGADLHTLETGSGFPTKSYKGKLTTNDLEYLDSPWNLNNLSKMNKSVLSQMNVDISGMKVPWAYVGMCFSCFCWHVEDHWSYSINYLHWGNIKTWYGVSGNDAEKFEDVMKKNAHELFEKSPDLLHHLVTIMNPFKMKKLGVPIYKINQNVGEFVITFPRAYHAGFNEGFNFAEAVNFCPADWMSLGRAAIENYKQMKRHTVFSHDELVCKIATNLSLTDLSIINEIIKELEYIIESEKKIRHDLTEKKVYKKSNKIAFESLTDDERTCDYCKTTCFVSAMYCSCEPNKLACLNHYQHLCKDKAIGGSPSKRKNIHNFTFIYRYSTNEMDQILNRLKNYTDDYQLWCRTVESILNLKNIKLPPESNDESPMEIVDLENESEESRFKINKKPCLRKIKELLEQAKINRYPRVKLESKIIGRSINLLVELDAEYKMAQQCAECCNQFINLYKNNFKTLNSNKFDMDSFMNYESFKTEDNLEEDMDDIDENSDDDIVFIKKSYQLPLKKRISINCLKKLVNNLNNLVCEIDEQALLITIYKEALEYEKKIDRMINEWNIESPNQLKRLLNYLNRIDIAFPVVKVEQLKLMHKQAVWLNSVNIAIQNPNELSIDMINDLIHKYVSDGLSKASNNNLNRTQVVDKTFVDLQELLSFSQTWDNKAKEQLNAKPPYKLEDLELTISEAKCIPAHLENVERLISIVKEANLWTNKVDKILNIDKNVKESNFPYLSDLIELLEAAQALPVKLSSNVIQMKIELMNEWIIRVNKLFNFSKINKGSTEISIDTSFILEVLSPRQDINSILKKMQTSTSNITNISDKPIKRTKIKSILTTETNSSDLPEISPIDIFSEEKNFTILREQIKQLEIKELFLIKKLRNLNQENLGAWKFQLSSNEKNEDNFNSNFAKSNNNNSGRVEIKCSSCYKHISSSVPMVNLKQCKLCQGIFHINNVCKGSNKSQSDAKSGKQSSTINDYLKQELNQIDLCFTCKRSKRPSLDQVLENIVSFEKLEMKSYESNALMLFVERILNWQEKFKKLFDSSELKEIYTLTKKLISKSAYLDTELVEKTEHIKKSYNELSDLKKVELNEFYVESLLLEIDLDDIRLLNELFNIVSGETSLEDVEKSELYELATDLVGDANSDEANNSDDTGSSKTTKKPVSKSKTKPNYKSDLVVRANLKSLKIGNKASTKSNAKSEKSISNKKGRAESTSDCDAQLTKKSATSRKNLKKKNTQKNSNQKKKDTSPSVLSEANNSQHEIYEDSDDSNEEFCAAFKCTEPIGDNIKWVQCDGSCNRWFHMICIGLTKIRKKETYICESCRNEDVEVKIEFVESEKFEVKKETNEDESYETNDKALMNIE